MFSTIKKIKNLAKSFDAFSERLDRLEEQLTQLQHIADENESLWQYLDDQREMEGVFVGTPEEFEEEITDMMLRAMKPRGDA
jgi:hypothetical protein|tara:strand:+ start:357 stop:602 length:246 start_codon:yes stop_codon:yes gene_type:complete